MNHFNEDNTAQIPALKLLINLGYQYLTPSEALQMREDRESNVLLTSILREQLKKINTIKIGSKQADFSDANIERAIHSLKDIPLAEGLVNASNCAYNLLRFGNALEQSIEGDKKSHTIQYIDWEKPETWLEAVKGIDTVYITFQPDLAIPTAPETIRQFTALAAENGVQKMVLL